MSEPFRLTGAQRAAARERIAENLALRSGAGCGKTYVLGRRFTELLLARPHEEDVLRRLVALTFTDKAAMEMRDRVRRFLAERAAGAKRDDRLRLLGWLDELTDARISTIHSFCAAVLRSRAIEAGLDPSFRVCADKLLTDRLAEEAADRAVLEAVEGERPDVLALLARLRYDELLGHVRTWLDHRAGWPTAEYLDPDATLARWRSVLAEERRRRFDELVEDADLRARLAALAAEPCGDPHDKLERVRTPAVAAMRHLLADLDHWTPEAFAAVAPAEKPGRVGSKGNWCRDLKEIRAELKDLAARFAEVAYLAEELGEPDRAAAEALAAVARRAERADVLYTADKRARGLLDFTDLLAHTARLVERSPAVRKALAEGIDQLLIDECQDTDAVQLGLLTRLLGEEGRLDDGRLFLVGDKKQSIYRFRGAQVEVFEDLCERLGPRNQETLDLSFRSHAAGVAFVNELFAPLMGDDYEPLNAHRRELPPDPSVEVVLARPDDGDVSDAGRAARLQAAATAERIAEMLDGRERIVWDGAAENWRPARPGDVAILFGRMTSSLAYERELAARGVPYYVVGGTGFFRQQEVFDVLNALRAIDNPYDDVAFVGALRSALFGLDDEALLRLSEAVRPPYLPALRTAAEIGRDAAQVVHGLPAPAARALDFAVELLGRLARQKDALGPDGLIDALMAETGYEGALRAQFQGRQKLGNVRRLAELARTAAADGTSPADLLTAMNERTIDESREEQAAVAGEAEDVVRLMTIHKAKGLEFPVVFVPDLNAGRRPVRDRLLGRLDTGVTLKLDTEDDGEDGDGPVPPLSYRVAKAREEADAAAEDIRRLYVAATRHEDRLVFVGADWRRKDGRFRAGQGSTCPLRQLDEVLGIQGAADAGTDLPYAGGRFAVRVQCRTPQPGRAQDRQEHPPGRRWLAEAASPDDLAGRMRRAAAPEPPPLLGPIPPEVGEVELAVTALGEFEQCPMLYRWRHELRAPVRPAAEAGAGPDRAESLDAATLGTLYHRCMELLDFADPQPAGALVSRALAEMELAEVTDPEPLAAELARMIDLLRGGPLWSELSDAPRAYRELDFVLDARPAVLRGQIDLLYRSADGRWHILDYKSDRLHDGETPAGHAARYEVQMLAYADAAGRFLAAGPDDDAAVADASLYFLRSGQTHTFELTPAALTAGRERIAALARRLIASRRSGRFERCESGACRFCTYGRLCRNAGAD